MQTFVIKRDPVDAQSGGSLDWRGRANYYVDGRRVTAVEFYRLKEDAEHAGKGLLFTDWNIEGHSW